MFQINPGKFSNSTGSSITITEVTSSISSATRNAENGVQITTEEDRLLQEANKEFTVVNYEHTDCSNPQVCGRSQSYFNIGSFGTTLEGVLNYFKQNNIGVGQGMHSKMMIWTQKVQTDPCNSYWTGGAYWPSYDTGSGSPPTFCDVLQKRYDIFIQNLSSSPLADVIKNSKDLDSSTKAQLSSLITNKVVKGVYSLTYTDEVPKARSEAQALSFASDAYGAAYGKNGTSNPLNPKPGINKFPTGCLNIPQISASCTEISTKLMELYSDTNSGKCFPAGFPLPEWVLWTEEDWWDLLVGGGAGMKNQENCKWTYKTFDDVPYEDGLCAPYIRPINQWQLVDLFDENTLTHTYGYYNVGRLSYNKPPFEVQGGCILYEPGDMVPESQQSGITTFRPLPPKYPWRRILKAAGKDCTNNSKYWKVNDGFLTWKKCLPWQRFYLARHFCSSNYPNGGTNVGYPNNSNPGTNSEPIPYDDFALWIEKDSSLNTTKKLRLAITTEKSVQNVSYNTSLNQVAATRIIDYVSPTEPITYFSNRYGMYLGYNNEYLYWNTDSQGYLNWITKPALKEFKPTLKYNTPEGEVILTPTYYYNNTLVNKSSVIYTSVLPQNCQGFVNIHSSQHLLETPKLVDQRGTYEFEVVGEPWPWSTDDKGIISWEKVLKWNVIKLTFDPNQPNYTQTCYYRGTLQNNFKTTMYQTSTVFPDEIASLPLVPPLSGEHDFEPINGAYDSWEINDKGQIKWVNKIWSSVTINESFVGSERTYDNAFYYYNTFDIENGVTKLHTEKDVTKFAVNRFGIDSRESAGLPPYDVSKRWQTAQDGTLSWVECADEGTILREEPLKLKLVEENNYEVPNGKAIITADGICAELSANEFPVYNTFLYLNNNTQYVYYADGIGGYRRCPTAGIVSTSFVNHPLYISEEDKTVTISRPLTTTTASFCQVLSTYGCPAAGVELYRHLYNAYISTGEATVNSCGYVPSAVCPPSGTFIKNEWLPIEIRNNEGTALTTITEQVSTKIGYIPITAVGDCRENSGDQVCPPYGNLLYLDMASQPDPETVQLKTGYFTDGTCFYFPSSICIPAGTWLRNLSSTGTITNGDGVVCNYFTEFVTICADGECGELSSTPTYPPRGLFICQENESDPNKIYYTDGSGSYFTCLEKDTLVSSAKVDVDLQLEPNLTIKQSVTADYKQGEGLRDNSCFTVSSIGMCLSAGTLLYPNSLSINSTHRYWADGECYFIKCPSSNQLKSISLKEPALSENEIPNHPGSNYRTLSVYGSDSAPIDSVCQETSSYGCPPAGEKLAPYSPSKPLVGYYADGSCGYSISAECPLSAVVPDTQGFVRYRPTSGCTGFSFTVGTSVAKYTGTFDPDTYDCITGNETTYVPASTQVGQCTNYNAYSDGKGSGYLCLKYGLIDSSLDEDIYVKVTPIPSNKSPGEFPDGYPISVGKKQFKANGDCTYTIVTSCSADKTRIVMYDAIYAGEPVIKAFYANGNCGISCPVGEYIETRNLPLNVYVPEGETTGPNIEVTSKEPEGGILVGTYAAGSAIDLKSGTDCTVTSGTPVVPASGLYICTYPLAGPTASEGFNYYTDGLGSWYRCHVQSKPSQTQTVAEVASSIYITEEGVDVPITIPEVEVGPDGFCGELSSVKTHPPSGILIYPEAVENDSVIYKYYTNGTGGYFRKILWTKLEYAYQDGEPDYYYPHSSYDYNGWEGTQAPREPSWAPDATVMYTTTSNNLQTAVRALPRATYLKLGSFYNEQAGATIDRYFTIKSGGTIHLSYSRQLVLPSSTYYYAVDDVPSYGAPHILYQNMSLFSDAGLKQLPEFVALEDNFTYDFNNDGFDEEVYSIRSIDGGLEWYTPGPKSIFVFRDDGGGTAAALSEKFQTIEAWQTFVTTTSAYITYTDVYLRKGVTITNTPNAKGYASWGTFPSDPTFTAPGEWDLYDLWYIWETNSEGKITWSIAEESVTIGMDTFYFYSPGPQGVVYDTEQKSARSSRTIIPTPNQEKFRGSFWSVSYGMFYIGDGLDWCDPEIRQLALSLNIPEPSYLCCNPYGCVNQNGGAGKPLDPPIDNDPNNPPPDPASYTTIQLTVSAETRTYSVDNSEIPQQPEIGVDTIPTINIPLRTGSMYTIASNDTFDGASKFTWIPFLDPNQYYYYTVYEGQLIVKKYIAELNPIFQILT